MYNWAVSIQEIWAKCSWDAPQHQFNFVRRLSWSISSIFQRKFTQVCVAAQNSKKSLKTHLFVIEGHSRSSMLVPPESSSAVRVMVCSKSVSICNHSRTRLVDSSRNHTFSRGYPNLMRSYGGLLEPKGSNLAPLKSAFNAEHFTFPGLSWMVSAQFTLKMCIAA